LEEQVLEQVLEEEQVLEQVLEEQLEVEQDAHSFVFAL
jgi:hypothetical protein